MQRNSFIQMSKLSNVRGRITYISSHAKQENLYAVYETAERSFWKELALCNQHEFQKSGTEGKCIEARELIIALPEDLVKYEPEYVLEQFTKHFRYRYGVECISALHHNKSKTNYHIHLIFSERKLLDEPIIKTATRSMFYDENGKRARTKKEVLDENGNIRKKCKVIKKGEIYEKMLFTIKDKRFKQESFLDEVKRDYTAFINTFVFDEKKKLAVFDKHSPYLATKKIGKNNPKEEQIKTDNEKRMRWNREVDRAIVSGVSETEIQQIKKEYITERIKKSSDLFGNKPEWYGNIIMDAVTVLARLISMVLGKVRELSARLFDTESTQPQTLKPKHESVISPPIKEMQIEPKIPPKPAMSSEVNAYPELLKIYKELSQQNEIIFVAEKERNALEIERDNLKGLAKLAKKGELQNQINLKNENIDILKTGLSDIVRRYGFQNVQDFYRAYRKAHSAYINYREQVTKWEETYGIKKYSNALHERIINCQRNTANQQTEQTTQRKDVGVR